MENFNPRKFISAMMNDDGKPFETEIDLTYGYVNATLLCQMSGVNFIEAIKLRI